MLKSLRTLSELHKSEDDCIETELRVALNRYFLLMIGIAAGALLVSLVAVHFLGKEPCTLCKMQRIPFALLLINAVFGISTLEKKMFLRVTQACCAFGLVLAATQFFMQMGVLPDFCVSKKDVSSPEAFLLALQSSKCSSMTWSFLGVPVSLLNAIVWSITGGVSLWMFPKTR